MTKIIILTGGSFQGKSLLALDIAHKFAIPLIICTDTIRSFFHIQQPNNPIFFTSTYKMIEEGFTQQKIEVSKLICAFIKICERRGESIIVEGMHLSKDFIDEMKEKDNALLMCLNNLLSIEKRLVFKNQTREHLKIRNKTETEYIYGKLTVDNLSESPYIKEKHRIIEIHNELVDLFKHNELPILSFADFELLKERVFELVTDFMKK